MDESPPIEYNSSDAMARAITWVFRFFRLFTPPQHDDQRGSRWLTSRIQDRSMVRCSGMTVTRPSVSSRTATIIDPSASLIRTDSFGMVGALWRPSVSLSEGRSSLVDLAVWADDSCLSRS